MPSTCETCRWWDTSTQHAQSESDTTGLCRARAPKINAMTGMAWWPFTEDTDWCRRHEPLDADELAFLGITVPVVDLDEPAPDPAPQDRIVQTGIGTCVIPAAEVEREDRENREQLERMREGLDRGR